MLIAFTIDKVNNYERLNEVDSALIYAFTAFKLSNSISNKEMMGKSLYLIGYLNKLRSDYDKAIKYLLKSEEFYQQTNLSNEKLKIYQQLSDSYSKIDNHEMAFSYSVKYADLNNAILKNDIAEAIDNAAIKYETSQTKYENELLARNGETTLLIKR